MTSGGLIRTVGRMNGLEEMQAAVVLAEELHFGRAAARLHTTQPSLTRRIRRLEHRIGASLFARTTRRVAVTDVGQAYLVQAREALSRAAQADDDARAVARGERGRLRLAFPGSAANHLLPAVLQAFRVAEPDVALDLVELFDDDELSARVLDGRVDASFSRLPTRSSALEIHVLGEEPLAAVLPVGHRLADRVGDLPLAELAEEQLLLWPRQVSPASFDELAAAFTSAGLSMRVTLEVPTVQSLLGLVAAGMGVTVVAESYDVLHRSGVVFRRLAGVTSAAHLVHRKDSASRVLPRFVHVAADVSASLGSTRAHPAPRSHSSRSVP